MLDQEIGQHGAVLNVTLYEPVSKRFSLVKVKESENVALTLHFVQPQEHIEYFEDSAIASLRAKFEFDAEIGRNGVF